MALTSKKTDREIANEKSERLMNTIAWRCAYYRANPQRFVKDYLDINLKLFQKILIWAMMHNNYVMYCASRGQGKSWLTALFCVVRCILFPESKIIVSAPTKDQGNEVLLKIQDDFMKKSKNLYSEISFCNIGQNEAKVSFKNGSWIRVVASRDTARSKRANIIIVDEFVKVDLSIINTVLRRFLTAPRHPKFYDKPEYKNYPPERNREIYMSSAWMKSHWGFEKLKSYSAQLIHDDKKYFACGLPYEISIKEGLLDKNQVADEMSESDFNELTWSMEMECLWFGDKDGSFFSFDDISRTRKIKNAIYPLRDIEDKKTKIPELQTGEKRVLSLDIALLASKKHNNDASAIIINSALPTSNNTYKSNIVYIETHEGLTTDDLALIVRRLFEQYKCTDLAIDCGGVGVGVYDALIKDIYDPDFGVTYKALCCKYDMVGTMEDRCKIPNALKVMWAIKGNADYNEKMNLLLRNGFQTGKINLLINEFEADEHLKSEFKSYSKLDMYEQTKLKSPFIQTTLLINELINLESDLKNNKIKLKEKTGARKDRFSSLGYNYWTISQMERDLQKPKQAFSYENAQYFASSVSFD